MKGIAQGLVLKQRHKVSRKSPIPYTRVKWEPEKVHSRPLLRMTDKRTSFGVKTISFPESSFPLTSGWKTRALGATILK